MKRIRIRNTVYKATKDILKNTLVREDVKKNRGNPPPSNLPIALKSRKLENTSVRAVAKSHRYSTN